MHLNWASKINRYFDVSSLISHLSDGHNNSPSSHKDILKINRLIFVKHLGTIVVSFIEQSVKKVITVFRVTFELCAVNAA